MMRPSFHTESSSITTKEKVYPHARKACTLPPKPLNTVLSRTENKVKGIYLNSKGLVGSRSEVDTRARRIPCSLTKRDTLVERMNSKVTTEHAVQTKIVVEHKSAQIGIVVEHKSVQTDYVGDHQYVQTLPKIPEPDGTVHTVTVMETTTTPSRLIREKTYIVTSPVIVKTSGRVSTTKPVTAEPSENISATPVILKSPEGILAGNPITVMSPEKASTANTVITPTPRKDNMTLPVIINSPLNRTTKNLAVMKSPRNDLTNNNPVTVKPPKRASSSSMLLAKKAFRERMKASLKSASDVETNKDHGNNQNFWFFC